MKVFVGFGYNDQDHWIEEQVFPILRGMGFSVVDGKRILFENDDSLFHELRKGNPSVKLVREQIAMSMVSDEIHEDVNEVISKLISLTSPAT